MREVTLRGAILVFLTVFVVVFVITVGLLDAYAPGTEYTLVPKPSENTLTFAPTPTRSSYITAELGR